MHGARVLGLWLVAGVLVAAAPAAASAESEVIVKYGPGVTAGERADVRAEVGGAVSQVLTSRTQVLDVDGSPTAALRELNASPEVLWAERNQPVTAQWTPNDPLFPNQWALLNTGQSGGTPGDDIDMTQAWDLGRGDRSVLTAVVDTGVSTANPDLAGVHYWTNPGEIAGNGIDDDHDGYVDDVHGWDFVDGDNTTQDGNGHGSGTTGTMAGATDDANGTAGVAPESTVIEARALDDGGNGSTANLTAALDYVAARGARVVNVSIGGGYSQAVADAINAYPNTLYVISAGNYSSNNDDPDQASYPCAVDAPNVLCVGASDRNDALASFSNYGQTTVDLMAPGVQIWGPYNNNSTIAYWSGTSFSAPLTAGVAALLLAQKPNATAARLKAAIMAGGDPVAAFATKSVSGTRLNAWGALQSIQADQPAAPNNLTPATITGTPQAWSTLTVDPGTWADAEDATFTYRWQRCDNQGRNCSDIPTSTQTLALTQADVTARFRAKVTATTVYGATTATTTITDPVQQAHLVPVNDTPPSISGTVQVGQTVTADPGQWRYTSSFDYQWMICDASGTGCGWIPGATGQTLQVPANAVGYHLRVQVQANNETASQNALSSVSGTVAGLPATVSTPTLPAAPTVGQLIDPQIQTTGAPAPSVDVTWQRCTTDLASCTTVSTDPTHAPQAAEIGNRLRVIVSASNAYGSQTATATSTGPVQGPPTLLVAPQMIGTASESQALSVAGDLWTTTPDTVAVSWQRCSAAGDECVPIPGQITRHYTLTVDDIGHVITASLVASSSLGASEPATVTSQLVQARPLTAVSPTGLSGSSTVGSALAGIDSVWTGSPTITVTHRWQRCDQALTGCEDIAGATGPTYTVSASDVGYRLRFVTAAASPWTTAPDVQISLPTAVVGPAIVPDAPTEPPHSTIPATQAMPAITPMPADTTLSPATLLAGPGAATHTAAAAPAPGSVISLAGRTATVTLICNATTRCVGSLTLSTIRAGHRATLGRAPFAIEPGRSARVSVRLPRGTRAPQVGSTSTVTVTAGTSTATTNARVTRAPTR